MPANTPIPTVAPMLSYEDAAAALVWLAKAFGFRERTRITMPDGSIGHAEMEIGDGIVMLAEPDPPLPGPQAARRDL
jgi:PhnB protein